ncbi:MAG: hypothetical protein IPJ30_01050 [Acidobacteria bacterium]|nr:hypothetical protein [Acidobacteriota bacterium]
MAYGLCRKGNALGVRTSGRRDGDLLAEYDDCQQFDPDGPDAGFDAAGIILC